MRSASINHPTGSELDRLHDERGEKRITQALLLQILPDVSAKALQNWNTRGVLGDGAFVGKGRWRLYSAVDAVVISFVQSVVVFGIPPSAAHSMSGHAKKRVDELLRANASGLAIDDNGIVERKIAVISKSGNGYKFELVGRSSASFPDLLCFFVVDLDRIIFDVLNAFAGREGGGALKLAGRDRRAVDC